MRFSTLVSAAAFFELSIAGYVLEDDYMTDFYSNFNFFTGPDPTLGFVDYVDEATARQSNLINASSTAGAHFGVDTTNKTPNGRPSIRIESKKKYNDGLIVLDLAHMPFGCGTWPAFWTLGPNWPKGGEIDILEGVNEFTNNGMTLHTSPGCHIGSDTSQFSGSVTTGNCDVNAKDQLKNAGCSIEHPSTKSYGAGLNQNGGGVYAMQWNSDAISVYFFPRGSVPADVLGDSPNPRAWGKPAAKFAGACDIDEMFAEQQIIIDTTFCGAWAGAAWQDSSCGKKANTCDEYVRDNPQAFTEAYWEINALKVYQDDGKAPVASSAPATPPKSSAVPVPAPPAATISGSYPTAAPPVSSRPAVPVPSSQPVPVVSSKPAQAPVAPLPSSAAAPVAPLPSSAPVPVAPKPSSVPAGSGSPTPGPQSSPTRGGSGSIKPTPTIDNQINAPTGAGGLPGWNWPQAGGNQPGDDAPAATTTAASTPEASGAPAQNTTGAVVTPAPQQNIAQPSQAPASPAQPGDAPAVPSIPEEPNVEYAHTVYETKWVTVTAAPKATPAPVVNKARMARHVREHRRRWTQHNARI
ncbi:hypothetical protein IQ06DRAFT_9400 [Phaeosphaeriaceae sp. SRC1lsM3a]|nr:hypothetical protein IQ06DRAFT_9400 [Stagonospora sp. SRC1lsM3a]